MTTGQKISKKSIELLQRERFAERMPLRDVAGAAGITRQSFYRKNKSGRVTLREFIDMALATKTEPWEILKDATEQITKASDAEAQLEKRKIAK